MAALQSSNAQQLAALRDELDSTAKRMGSTGNELQRARAMVARLQKSQQQQAEELKQEISKKADEEKVGALTQDVSTEEESSTTRRTIDFARYR